MQFLQKLILNLKGRIRLKVRFPFIGKLIGKELLAKLTPRINIFKSILVLKLLMVYGINSDLHAAIEKHVPHKCCSSRNRPPWISAKICKLLRSTDRLYRKSAQARKKNKESIKNKLRNLKHKIRRETIAAYWNYVETNILPETSDEPNRGNKKLWSFINHRKTNSVGVTPLKYKGTLWDKPKDKAEILNEQFKSVFPDPTHDEPEPRAPKQIGLTLILMNYVLHQMVYNNYSKTAIQIDLWDPIKFIRGC